MNDKLKNREQYIKQGSMEEYYLNSYTGDPRRWDKPGTTKKKTTKTVNDKLNKYNDERWKVGLHAAR